MLGLTKLYQYFKILCGRQSFCPDNSLPFPAPILALACGFSSHESYQVGG